jgi:nicotinate phosphoribosyltransferase
MLHSILDTDLYKLTMQQAVHRLYPWMQVEYTFINRGQTSFPSWFARKLQETVGSMADLQLQESEVTFLKGACPFLSPVYLDFLKSYRFDPTEVGIQQQAGDLQVSVKGPWYRTILWEVPLMAAISELYFQGTEVDRDHCRQVNQEKAERFRRHNVRFADFGTRRRFSFQNQLQVLQDFIDFPESTLVGTSNVWMAKLFDLRPIGTHAHEWFMVHGALNGYRLANKTALDAWSRVYEGDLGIALTDTYTTEMFLRSFNSVYARLFDGIRHDSGDPLEFADLLVEHYRRLRIDPMSKTIVFSDGLSVDKAIKIQYHCQDKIQVSFGIGTHLTNDVGATPLNMVIKLTSCQERSGTWYPTVKLSDTPGKHTGAPEEIEQCLRTVKQTTS